MEKILFLVSLSPFKALKRTMCEGLCVTIAEQSGFLTFTDYVRLDTDTICVIWPKKKILSFPVTLYEIFSGRSVGK